jgi:hypothetical protein
MGILVDEGAWEAAAVQAEADCAATKGRSAFKVIEMDGGNVLWKQ